MASRTKRPRKWRAPESRVTSRRKRATKKRSSKKKAGGARAMWKGRLAFGSVDVPVKLYSGVQDKSIHFRLLDAKHKEPIKQQMIDPETGDVVPHEEIHSAYQTKAGELVMLDDEELEATEPEPSRDIEITRFVNAEDVASSWYDRPYWLGPDGETDKTYFALAKALANQKRQGIARWVMRNKHYVGALKAEGDYLVLITLRHAGEVVPASSLPAPGGRAIEKKELAMAKQLVDTLREDLNIGKYKDEYRERVLELVEAKAKGKVIKFAKAPKREETTSLASVLQRSLATAKKEKQSA
jgi:DNA end-binding protein Ku